MILVVSLLTAGVEHCHAQREAGGGPGGRGLRGGPPRGAVQQKPGKPAPPRYLRVCRVLELNEEQLNTVRAAYDSMLVKREEALEKLRQGVLEESEASRRITSLGEKFEAEFKEALDGPQREKFEKLKEDGILEKEWW